MTRGENPNRVGQVCRRSRQPDSVMKNKKTDCLSVSGDVSIILLRQAELFQTASAQCWSKAENPKGAKRHGALAKPKGTTKQSKPLPSPAPHPVRPPLRSPGDKSSRRRTIIQPITVLLFVDYGKISIHHHGEKHPWIKHSTKKSSHRK